MSNINKLSNNLALQVAQEARKSAEHLAENHGDLSPSRQLAVYSHATDHIAEARLLSSGPEGAAELMIFRAEKALDSYRDALTA